MAVNETPIPSYGITAVQTDKEILESMVGFDQKGGTFVLNATAGPGNDGLLDAGTVVSRNGAGKYLEYVAGTSEVQTITVDATGGTFDLTVAGETLAAVAFDVTATALQALLESLLIIEPGDIVVTGGPGATAALTLTYGGRFAGEDVPPVVTDPASLTGGAGTAVVATGTPGVVPALPAVGVLRHAVNVATADVLGNIVLGGTLKLDQLIGLDDAAISDLNGRTDTVANTFKF